MLLVHQWESLSWFKDLASIIRCRISSYSCHIEILRVSKLCLMHTYYVAARQCIHMSTYTTVAERDTAAAAQANVGRPKVSPFGCSWLPQLSHALPKLLKYT